MTGTTDGSARGPVTQNGADGPGDRRRWRSLSVTTRLLALVLMPLVGMFAVDAGAMRARLETAQAATDVAEGVERIERLVGLASSLAQERFYADWAAGARALNVDLVASRQFFGFDVEERFRQHAADVDRAVENLGVDADLVTPGDVATARKGVATRLSEETLTASYVPVQERIEERKNRIIADLQPRLDVAGGNAVAAGLAATRVEMELADTIGQQIKAATVIYMASGDEARHTRDLIALRATQTRALDELRQSPDATVVASADELVRHQATQGWRSGVDAMLEGNVLRYANGAADWRRMTDLVLTGMDFISRTYELILTTTGNVTAVAGTLADDARADLTTWSVYANVIGVASLAVSVLLGASISRPLRRLRQHAAALSVGDVHVEPLPPGGPRDVAVTARAFNDLVANLRVLEAKARALADLDFEAEALALPLPGSLGQSLQRSLRTLSGSISERDEMRSHILHQASHDDLTGLPNRSAAIEELDQARARARRVGRGVGVLLVDIDGFKRVNDVHGHRVGDAVLRDVARRLDRLSASSSLLARVGGDEFLVLVEDLDGPEPVVQAARDLAAALRRPMRVDGVSVALSVCVGVGFSWDGGDDRDELLVAADLAVARAKERGPGTVEIHDRALQEQFVAQAAVEDALVPALAGDDQLFLVYQPVVDLASGEMTSAEALVRWNRPGLGVQPPDSFIPVAERSNLIIELDRWVLARAARQLEAWTHHPRLGDVDVAVNVSGRHLTNQSLFDHVRDLLDTSGVDPRRVILEITETALVDDLVVAAAQLEAIRRLGVRIALDDFGTGYTSIAHLRRLPVDIIKIDRSLVQRLNRETDRALVRMVVELGHQLGTTITAEGVETAEQYEQLRALGCDRAQGYLLSRPLPTDDLERWADDRAEAAAPAPAGEA